MSAPLPLTPEILRAHFRRLPGSPQAVQKVLELLRLSDVTVPQIARAVEADADLTLRVLRTANSPFYGSRGGITAVRDACRVLGVHTLGNVAMAALALAQFPATGEYADWRRNIWRHGAAVGAIARVLARNQKVSSETAYTAGLLHDIGRIALQACFPAEYKLALMRCNDTDIFLREAETAVFGMDHCAVGAELIRVWQLPATMANALAQHHPGADGVGDALGDLLHIADVLSKKLGLGDSGELRCDGLEPNALARRGISAEELEAKLSELETEAKAALAEFDACGVA